MYIRMLERHGLLTFAIAAFLMVLPGVILSVKALAAQPDDSVLCRSLVDPWPRLEQTRTVLSRGKFLVADRNMKDPRFAEAVLLLVDYGPQGAMGLIINRPTEVRLSSIFPKIAELKQRNDIVYIGGPVNVDRMFLLIRSIRKPEDSLNVFGDIYISSSENALRRMIGSAGSGKKFRAYAGYAGWSPQQLDQEVLRGDWHVVQADAKTIFDKKSSEIWPALIEQSLKLWVRDTGDFPSTIFSMARLTCPLPLSQREPEMTMRDDHD